MNRFVGLIITVVAIAALIGAAIGWRFPFLGQNQRANQLAQQRSQNQTTNGRRTQPANQPNTPAPNNTPNANNPDDLDPEAPNTQNQPAQETSDASAPAALW
jgi:cytoskeletal protein RodZ